MSSRTSRGRVTAAAVTIAALAGSALVSAAPASANYGAEKNGSIAFSVGFARSVYITDDVAASPQLLLMSTYPTVYDDLSYSADGAKIVYVSTEYNPVTNPEANPEIWMADANGMNPQQLTTTGASIQNRDPSLSPDGSQVVFVSNNFPQMHQELAIMDAQRGAPMERLTKSFQFEEADPVWSPGGVYIAYATRRYVPGTTALASWDIFITSANRRPDIDPSLGSDLIMPNMLQQPHVDELNPDWSPDGKRITFSRTYPYGNRILTSRVDGADEVLLDEGVAGTDPAYSPDGTRIAYAANDASGWSIRTMKSALPGGLDGREVARIDGDTVSRPAWQPVNPTDWAPHLTPIPGELLQIVDHSTNANAKLLNLALKTPELSLLGDALSDSPTILKITIDGRESKYELRSEKWIATAALGQAPWKYQYKDTKMTEGPIGSVIIDLRLNKITVAGDDGGLTHVMLTKPSLVKVEILAGEVGFCAHFGGAVTWTAPYQGTAARTFKATKAKAPAAC